MCPFCSSFPHMILASAMDFRLIFAVSVPGRLGISKGRDTKMNATQVKTVRIDQLARVATVDLIAQYDKAISTYAGRLSNKAPRQARIDYMVNLLTERADHGDMDALAWFAS